MLRFLIFSPCLLFIQSHTSSSIQCNLCSACSCFHIPINIFPFHFFFTGSSSFLPFSEALTGVMCRGKAPFFSFQAWVSYWGATLDLHLISLQPSSCGQARHSLSPLQDRDAVTLSFRSGFSSWSFEMMRHVEKPFWRHPEQNEAGNCAPSFISLIRMDVKKRCICNRRLLRMNENFKCLLCISKFMFHLGGYADQQRVLKLFIAGAQGYKSTVLLVRYAPFTILFPLEER